MWEIADQGDPGCEHSQVCAAGWWGKLLFLSLPGSEEGVPEVGTDIP